MDKNEMFSIFDGFDWFIDRLRKEKWTKKTFSIFDGFDRLKRQ